MRDRYRSLVATIATSALIACGDAAVGDVTAPRLAATPAAPVADEWPSVDDYTANDISGAIGIRISVDSRFSDDYKTFVVVASVHFEWANEVLATVTASSSRRTAMSSIRDRRAWVRPAGPSCAAGDTTLTVRISTNNVTCGLIGKSSYSGTASAKALDVKLVQITLWSQTIPTTNGPDVLQPARPPYTPPPPDECESPVSRVIAGTTGALTTEAEDCPDENTAPTGSGGDDYIEVCYTVWRELWYWDPIWGFQLADEWFIGTYCYVYQA
jgi:hypothetical protein